MEILTLQEIAQIKRELLLAKMGCIGKARNHIDAAMKILSGDENGQISTYQPKSS